MSKSNACFLAIDQLIRNIFYKKNIYTECTIRRVQTYLINIRKRTLLKRFKSVMFIFDSVNRIDIEPV